MNEDNVKVSYEQIKKANEEIIPMKVGATDYAKVSERVKAFRKVYPTGSVTTEIEDISEDSIRIKATIYDENGDIIATGRASESKPKNGKFNINTSSMIENCETSAVGRALGFAGFGIDKDIASGEDVQRNKYENKKFEIFNNMYIADEDAKKVIKSSIGELMRKMGVVKASLADKVMGELWTTLEEMGSQQLLKLETKLRTINMKDSDWHELYHENKMIKEVVAEDQEVLYESSWSKFGKLALEQAGTDGLLRNEILDFYLDVGIDLSKLIGE